MARKTVLAVDIGAESGRVMAVHYDGHSLQAEELHRFPNLSVNINGTLTWDFLSLWHHVQKGIEKGRQHQPVSLGVDTWAVDFGLLDRTGNLISNPVHYRDSRTDGMMEAVFARVPKAEVFAQTGIQFMPINTLYQMMSLAVADSPQLQIAETFLTAPDLLNYWLTGAKVCEFTNATTTQMLDPRTGTWAFEMLDRLGIPTKILPEVVLPGTQLGSYHGIPVIAPACHDTGSAVAAVPAQTPNYAYISSGTWSLVGIESPEAVINEATAQANFTNEGGINKTYRLLKNVMGLWILQQCRGAWSDHDYSYEQLVEMAGGAAPLKYLFDVDDPRFLAPGDHPAHIQAWCREKGQPVPETHAEIVRAVLESLALKYRFVIERLEAISGQPIEVIHVVGGGSQNALLNQLTADASGRPVVAGPVEATALGNAMVQLIALGELRDLSEARQLMSGSYPRFTPGDKSAWDAAFNRVYA
jgi:rhamnulokinase